jgi:hypothetical protein
VGERLAADPADDQPLPPAERLQGADLAGALVYGRQRQQAGDQERAREGDGRQGDAELRGQVLGVDERSGDPLREVGRGGDLRSLERALDLGLRGGDLAGARRSNLERIDAPDAIGER